MKSMFKSIKKKMGSTENGSDGQASSSTDTSSRTDSKSAKSRKSTAGRSSTSKSSSARVQYTKADLLKPIASFSDTPSPQRTALFIQKLRLCSVLFNWDSEDQKDAKAKDMKRLLLLELVEYIGKNKSIFQDTTVLSEIVQMVSANFFRALPPEAAAPDEADEDEPVFEPSWPHLQIVYEFFLRILASQDIEARVLKKYVDTRFILRILALFNCEDHRERDYLKTMLHRIYARFMPLRAFIRKSINNVFFTFIYETEQHRGIAELLEILGSVINGFALPLKQEHKNFLRDVLIPMHRVPGLAAYQPQLGYCVVQLVSKDASLSVPVITGLLKYWPHTSSQKEVLFAAELEELLELTLDNDFETLVKPLFARLAMCIESPHFQVAERVLFYWHHEYISGLIINHRAAVLSIIFKALKKNSQHHWNGQVHSLSKSVLKSFVDADVSLSEQVQRKARTEEQQQEKDRAMRDEQWKDIEEKYPCVVEEVKAEVDERKTRS